MDIHQTIRLLYHSARLAIMNRQADSNERFVKAAYRTLLGREPEAEGLSHYYDQLACTRASRRDILRHLAASPEREEKAQLHRLRHSHPPIPVYLRLLVQFWRDYRRLRQNNPTVSDNQLFLRAAYHVLLKREPDLAGESVFGEGLAQQRFTRHEVLNLLRLSHEFPQIQGLALYPMLQLRLYWRVLVEYAWLLLQTPRWHDDRTFLRAAYRALLDRSADEQEMRFFLDKLRRKSMTRLDMLGSIAHAAEFKCRFGLPIRPIDAIHQSRMILFQQYLPPAKVIVDLGGAAHNDPHGALLAMGYPHRPRDIIIVDLPPPDRIGGREAAEASQHLVTDEGTTIHYLYSSMADLAPIPDASADMVVSGESIEHISETEADVVCEQVYRILKPGGYFCLDTPNALLTRLESPDKLIHPEHQKEYHVHEMRAKLERYGFQIVDAKGICPLAECIKRGKFDYVEMEKNIGVSDNPEEGYMFYFKAHKPVL